MKTGDHDKDPLAQWADRVLRQAPERRAPSTLVPRVVAEIRRRANLPWYRRPWLQWSGPQRWMSVVVLSGALYGFFGWLIPSLNSAAVGTATYRQASRVPGFIDVLWDAGSLVLDAVARSAETIPPWAFTAMLAIVVFSWLSTVGLGTACWRIARHSR